MRFHDTVTPSLSSAKCEPQANSTRPKHTNNASPPWIDASDTSTQLYGAMNAIARPAVATRSPPVQRGPHQNRHHDVRAPSRQQFPRPWSADRPDASGVRPTPAGRGNHQYAEAVADPPFQRHQRARVLGAVQGRDRSGDRAVDHRAKHDRAEKETGGKGRGLVGGSVSPCWVIEPLSGFVVRACIPTERASS